MKTEKVSAVVDTMNKCCICGNPHVQIHRIFYGTANRIHSDHYNLIVPLCLAHHTGTNGVHNNKELDSFLKRKGQRAFEQQYGHEKFMAIFGKNYL